MTSVALTSLYSYNPYREAISALIWSTAPCAINILTSKPTENASKIDYIREKLFGIRTQFLKLTQTNKLTKYSWFILNDVIIANMGFATFFILAIQLIDRTKPYSNISSYGLLTIKLLLCIIPTAYRENLAKENKDRNREPLPEEKAWVLAEEDFYDVQGIMNGKKSINFRRIPCILFDRTEFQKRKCAITNRPIREVVMIRESQTSAPIYYEYNNLVNWHAQEGNTPPPNWPESIAFHRQAITIDPVETAQVTEDLQKVLNYHFIKNQAKKHAPKLEKKLREELSKHIDSLKLPDQSSLIFKQMIESRPIPQLIDRIKLVENTLGNISQKRLSEIITAHVANQLMLLGFTTADIKELLINSDDSLALFNLKSSKLPLHYYHLVLQILKKSEALERISLLDMIRFEDSSANYEQLQELESQIREAFYTRIAIESSLTSWETDVMVQNYLNYLKTHQNDEQEDPREVLNLLDLSTIPSFLHNDEILKKHICSITLEPIRDPVQDPTTEPGENPILYERTAIKNWLEIRGKSPVTQKELTLDMLISRPDIKCIIDMRLQFHQENMDMHLAESAALIQNNTRSNTLLLQ